MKEKSTLLEQRIVECLKNQYGIEATTLIFLPWGADIHASIYKAQTLDQSTYFIKLKLRNSHDISVPILTLLRNAGIQQIIPLIPTIQGQFTQRLGDDSISVYPFIEGQDGFHRKLTDTQWTTLGKALRQIHEMDVPPPIQEMIRQETYSSKWRQAVRSLYKFMESEPKGDKITTELLAFMKKQASVIHRLVDRAEQLSKKIQNQSPKFVLCHSDIHGGNVLIDKKDAIYIVDWDDPIMAPRERDLMFIGGGVNNVWNKPHEAECFYKGYGKTEVNMKLLAYYRHERIVEDIAVYGQALLLETGEGHYRLKLYEEFMSQFAPQGVVEIAFKTDEG
jgi:spectinomycin phosphotransferase